jgi:hypothetical protein
VPYFSPAAGVAWMREVNVDAEFGVKTFWKTSSLENETETKVLKAYNIKISVGK